VVGGPPEERGWRPHRIPVPDGGRLELTVEAPGSRVIESAFAGLELELERRAPRTRSSPDRPNLVLVVIDTLRADRLSSQGYSRPTSPALDALAEDGVRWSDAWSVAPWTWPSTASILTGAQPPEHGVLNEFSCYLPETREVLAERLRAEGFATAAVSTNPLISPGQNFDQGFDTYELLPWARSTEALPRAIERLESFGDERFLLYLHLTDPHLPFEPEPELRERFVETRGAPSCGDTCRSSTTPRWPQPTGASRPCSVRSIAWTSVDARWSWSPATTGRSCSNTAASGTPTSSSARRSRCR
jgi:hypothetical protein